MAITDQADRQAIPDVVLRPAESVRPRLWWALVAVTVLILTFISIFRYQSGPPEPSEAEDAALLMDAVTVHLSRKVPAPMEPVIVLLPEDERFSVSGGLQ
jgi:hypothetical protein